MDVVILDALGFALFAAFAVLTVIGLSAEIDMLTTDSGLYRAVGTRKDKWVIAVLVTGGIAGVIWWFTLRKKLHAAVRRPPPPGFYPEEGTGNWRWWDGERWVGPPQPPPTGRDG